MDIGPSNLEDELDAFQYCVSSSVVSDFWKSAHELEN